ncbi:MULTISPECIES: ATP-binding cassette domain-containing protein [unclassified Cellulomonas]|uniref:ABC transporter ATP-binding protein n=1 Tax=unclassified Cellulomonas TaxID=2620175 RepID=UPI0024B7AA55|nr:ATP-binding cassette domain-containing protein [Cellulomonas sp. ES6]WHP18731.1 ATP-binding cassette domain-containing protein [Cellulomonas sp. ES6]
MTVVELDGVTKSYPGREPVPVLRDVGLSVRAGERLAVVGRSGAGKSTLLNLLGLLDVPTSGRYRLLGSDTSRLRRGDRDRLRSGTIGFVFQEHHVLGHRTVGENVDLALAASGVPHRDRPTLVDAALRRVGLGAHVQARSGLLSGGEKQRLAVARAVVTRPRLLLADEPTGNLDDENAADVLRLFREQADDGVAVVVITHSARVAAWAHRVLEVADGRLRATAPPAGARP